MHATKLDLGCGERGVDRFWEALETIDASNGDVLPAAVLQLS